jgi:hypothetical protein
MTYDMCGGFENTAHTGHHTNLYTSSLDPAAVSSQYSFDNTVKLFHNKYGIPFDKLLGGAAFYGRGWKEVDSVNHGLYRNGEVNDGGYVIYRELVNPGNEGFKLYWDKSALAQWLYNSNKKIFWSIDTPQSVALKTRYCKAHHLRGMMFWELSGDDDKGSLINAIYTMNVSDIPIIKSNIEKKVVPVSIVKPANGDYYTEGSDIVINTGINNEESSIVKVEFFIDNNSIGFAVGGSFDWAWFNASIGEHTIKAVTHDIWGGVSESFPVKIIVENSGSYIKR